LDTNIDHTARNRIVAAIFVSQSLYSAAIILSFTLTPIIIVGLSGNDQSAGLPSTLNLLGRAMLAYPIGWLLDRFGRRRGLTMGYLLGLVGSALAVWSIVAKSPAGFLASAALVGGSRAASEQSRYIAAEIYPFSRQAKIIGVIVFAGTV